MAYTLTSAIIIIIIAVLVEADGLQPGRGLGLQQVGQHGLVLLRHQKHAVTYTYTVKKHTVTSRQEDR